jgi:NADH dehydrogenase (ubiquinone) 1 beta subcomplex subunit 9
MTYTQTLIRSLRNLISWTESRDLFNEEATKIRMRFNENKNIDIDSGKRLLLEGQKELSAQTHADPYIPAYMPGGSLFMRNPALPLEALFPDGIPSHINKRRINIDMSNVPDDQEFSNKVLVDSISKQYWIDK